MILAGRRRTQPPLCVAGGNCVNRLGTWNVRGINGIEKSEEAVDVFRKGTFELLALTETS